MSLDLYLHAVVDLGGPEEPHAFQVHEDNITYNLCPMLDSAGPEWDFISRKSEGREARDIRPAVATLLDKLLADPRRFKELNPSNGWGTYEGAIEFLRNLDDACRAAPLAVVHLSR